MYPLTCGLNRFARMSFPCPDGTFRLSPRPSGRYHGVQSSEGWGWAHMFGSPTSDTSSTCNTRSTCGSQYLHMDLAIPFDGVPPTPSNCAFGRDSENRSRERMLRAPSAATTFTGRNVASHYRRIHLGPQAGLVDVRRANFRMEFVEKFSIPRLVGVNRAR